MSKINKSLFLVLVFLFVAVDILDGISTRLAVEKYGIESESNKYTRWFYNKWEYKGLYLKFCTDIIIIVVGSIGAYYVGRNNPYIVYVAMIAGIVWIGEAVINNFYWVLR